MGSHNTSIRGVRVLDGIAGPVGNLTALLVTNNSIHILWTRPFIVNGTLSGYSVYVDGRPVSHYLIMLHM